MMQAAVYHDQGKARAASGGLACGMGKPAPIAGRYQSQLRGGRHSHRRRAGTDLLPGTRSVATSVRVGWCFNTAAEFLEFHALTRGGVQPLHAVAVMSPVLPADQSVSIQASLSQPKVEPAHRVHSFALSHEQTDSQGHLEACSLSRGIEFPQ